MRNGFSRSLDSYKLDSYKLDSYKLTDRQSNTYIRAELNTVELGYNVMKGTEYFVSL